MDIKRDWGYLQNEKEDILLIEFINGSFLERRVIIKYPKDTPNKNGNFELKIFLPNDYPFGALNIRLVTKIFNINFLVGTGSKNSDLIGISKWFPNATIYDIINLIIDI